MKFKTRYHGVIEYNENEVIHMVKGMTGFENLSKYVLVPVEDNEVFKLFHSIEDDYTGFIVVSPFYVKKDYKINLSNSITEELKIQEANDVMLLNTVTLSNDIKKITTNLSAPIIINIKEHLGKQIIISDDESMVKYPIINS